MERFEVFNRALGQWEGANIEVVAGWQANYVQDKTTDTMNLKVKYNSETAPDWNNGDWCRFIHLANNETSATYRDVKLERIPSGDIYNEISVVYDTNIGDYGGFVVNSNITLNEIIEVEILYTAGTGTKRITVTLEKNSDRATYLFEEATTIISYSKTQVIRYNWLHFPLNHEQYVIGSISLVKNELSDCWDCQLSLKEPIEVANGILIETRSFTNQISAIVDGVEYTHDALNHLNVLETILKSTPANNDLSKSWYSRIKILHKDLLENTPFNDETLSEQNLYGLLLDKYDSSIGRTPVFYFDINNDDLPSNLEKETYMLDFLRQDGFDKESVNLEDLLEGHNEYIINKSDENFTDGIVSNYDNLSVNTATYYPSENYFGVPEIDTNERDVSNYGEQSDTQGINSKWILKIPHNIKKINKITRYEIGQYIGEDPQLHFATYVDYFYKIKNDFNIYEEKEYNAESDDNKRAEAIWFKEGDNKIHINEIKRIQNKTISEPLISEFVNETNWIYNVEYEPLISARYDLGKDYQTQLNQNDSQVDNVKFGKYIQDYFASMNKADLTITKTISDFNDIVELGSRVIDGSKTYLITNISIQNRGFDYDIVYQLNENHFRRSDNVVASQEIRKNIELSIDATKERKSMLPFGYKISLTNSNTNDELNAKNYIVSSLLTNTDNLKFIQTALLNMKGNYKNQGVYSIKRYCEVAKYVLNNTFCLNMKYFDNAEAGKQSILHSTKKSRNNVDYYVYGLSDNQIPVLYTNYFGEFEQFDIDFKPLQTDLTNILDGANYNVWYSHRTMIPAQADENFKINQEFLSSSNYPLYDEDLAEPTIFSINDINYYKDMLDTFNYTVGLHCESDENIILCKAFFDNSILVTNTGAKISRVKTYSQNMQQNDYAITEFIEESSVTGTINGNEITIQLSDALNTAKSIILVDENDNPLLIINDFDKTINTNSFDNIKIYC